MVPLLGAAVLARSPHGDPVEGGRQTLAARVAVAGHDFTEALTLSARLTTPGMGGDHRVRLTPMR